MMKVMHNKVALVFEFVMHFPVRTAGGAGSGVPDRGLPRLPRAAADAVRGVCLGDAPHQLCHQGKVG